MIQTDLRDFLAAVDDAGQLKIVNGAHWDKEMGAVTEVLYRQKVDQSPALLFDDIPGYPKGWRCLYGMLGSPARLALALGMDAQAAGDRMAMLNDVRKKMALHEPIDFRTVSDAPVLENIVEGDDVDMFKFPVPIHHEADGGRYIGTACGVITRDPDTGRVNMGTYRVQAIGANKATSYISNGKQGMIQRDKYLDAGKPCPMAIVIGIDPVSFLAARYTLPDSVCELDWAGALTGGPLDVLEGGLTGLPIPAGSEIVMEGEVSPTETTEEGPFGEWHGYYAGGARPEPVITIQRIYYRNNPILTCAASQKPPHSHLFERCFLRSAALWDSLDGAQIPDVRGAWVHQGGSGRTFVVVAIKQRYFGHATQAGLIASQINPTGYCGRYVVVVDDDIDPSDIHDVLWAMGTRSDPKTDITLLDKCWSSRLDPMVKSQDELYNSRCVINACIPYERIDDFPAVAQTSRELAREVMDKFPDVYS
ncbi:MAG: UbiD family decarboxylase [Gammaproteobacteria bacterium]|nr:UbiD family decarboxylase [Gammaproteobacteria bacterium]MDH3505724.1 UbiD family decarboxylase [Gammaproteobacteria bacterium]